MTDPGSSCLEPSARIVRGGGDATGNTTHTAIPLIGGAVMNIAKHCGLAPLPLPAAPGGMGGILGGSGSGTGPACGHWGSDNGGGGWQVGLRGGGLRGKRGRRALGGALSPVQDLWGCLEPSVKTRHKGSRGGTGRRHPLASSCTRPSSCLPEKKTYPFRPIPSPHGILSKGGRNSTH